MPIVHADEDVGGQDLYSQSQPGFQLFEVVNRVWRRSQKRQLRSQLILFTRALKPRPSPPW
jgi:hypothetical protein